VGVGRNPTEPGKMKFGPVSLARAEATLLAQALKLGALALKKRCMVLAQDLRDLADGGASA
jgi:hypothetical protein